MKYKEQNLIPLQFIFLLAYFAFALVFLYLVAIPYLEMGDLDAPKLFADSITYQNMCKDAVGWDDYYWIRDAGPCLEAISIGDKYFIVFLFNSFLIFQTIRTLAHNYSLKLFSVAFLILINPITFLSLFSINKEVFSIYAISLTLSTFKSHRLMYVPFAIFFAAMARLPLLLVILIFFIVFFSAKAMPSFTKLKIGKLTGFLMIMSVASSVRILLGDSIAFNVLGDISDDPNISISTLYSLKIEEMAHVGFYAVVYLIRLSLNLFGAIPNLFYATFQTHGVYYYIGVIGSSLIFLFYSILAAVSRFQRIYSLPERFWIANLFFVYTMTFCISPVIQHRYFYPLLPIFIIAIAAKKCAKDRND